LHVAHVKPVPGRNISDNGNGYFALSVILTAGGPNAQRNKFTAAKLTYMKVSNWPSAVSEVFILNGCNGHAEVRHERLLTGVELGNR